MGRPLTAVRLLEVVATALIVIAMSNALVGPLLDPLQTGGDSNPVLRLMWLPIYGLIAALAALRVQKLAQYWLPAAMFGLLIGWAFASASWSLFPQISERRAIAVAVTTLFGLYLAAAYSGRMLSEVLAGSFQVLALGSYFVCLAVPSLGVHHDVNAGLWRGLWYEKNQMGATMVYGALAAVTAAILSPPRRPLWIATLVLCVGLIVMTRSATSALALAVVMCGVAVLSFMRRGPAGAIAAVWIGVTFATLLGAVVVLAPEALYQALGKDPTLTGRTQIWQLVERASDKAPLLGYGFAAFWDVKSAPANWIREQLQWVVPTAHNGWLDLKIQLGAIGVAMFGALLASSMIAGLVRRDYLKDSYFALLFLAVYSLTILSESFILAHNSLPWVLASACMARALGPRPESSAMALPAPPSVRAEGELPEPYVPALFEEKIWLPPPQPQDGPADWRKAG